MNRAEATEACEALRYDHGQDASLRPWTKVPATCAWCQLPPARLIGFDGQFLCEDHADTRLNELSDQHGVADSWILDHLPSWRGWLWGNLYWRPRHWLIYKQGPFRPFRVKRAWCNWI